MKTLFILLYLLSFLHASAQSITTERTDYIVTNDNDTVAVSIVLPSTEGLASGDSVWIPHKLITIIDHHSVEFSPRDLRAFHYKKSDYESIWCKENTTGASRQFCQRIEPGEIVVYRCDVVGKNATGSGLVPIFYFKKYNDLKVASLLHLQQLLGPIRLRSYDSLKRSHAGEWGLAAFMAIVRQCNQYQQPKTSH